MTMRQKTDDLATGFWTLAIILMLCVGGGWASLEAVSPDESQLLFIIHFDDFMCFSCLESLLGFCQSLPQVFLEKKAWGIVVFDEREDDADEEIAYKIIERKLAGFIKANHIGFPFFIDQDHLFLPLTDKGSSVLVFNSRMQILSQFVFPLTQKDTQGIAQILF